MSLRIPIALCVSAAALLFPGPAESQPRADSAGIFKAVAAHLQLERTRDDSARAEACGSAMPQLCLPRVAPVWYVRDSSSLARELARLLGVPAEIGVVGQPEPACPWPPHVAPPGAGLRTTAELELSSDGIAYLTFGQSCDNPRGYMHDLYVRETRFTVRRERKGWIVEDVSTIVS